MKVRANTVYRYNPVLLDQIDGRTSLKLGDLVRVVNLPGCPRANTMGHCHVADPNTGHFIGLVCCNSLEPINSKPQEKIMKPFDWSEAGDEARMQRALRESPKEFQSRSSKMFAMVSDQGTAAHETALCEQHFTPEYQAKIRTPHDVPERNWIDCTGNDALVCTVCGREDQ